MNRRTASRTHRPPRPYRPSMIERILLALVCAFSLAAHAAARQQPPADAPPAAVRGSDKLRAALTQRMETILGALNGDFMSLLEEQLLSESLSRTYPIEKVLADVRRLHERSGGFQQLERRNLGPTSAGAWIEMNADHRLRWIVRIEIDPTPPYSLRSLDISFTPGPDGAATSMWDTLDQALGSLNVACAVGVYEVHPGADARLIYAYKADQPMSLGTHGAMWMHLTLARTVASGRAEWTQQLAIDELQRTPPPSRTSRAVPGEMIMLGEFARRALYENDATAFDHIFNWLGRDAIEETVRSVRGGSPADTDPYLSMNEFYRLKCSVSDIVNEYAQANPAERRRLLAHELLRHEIDVAFYYAWMRPQVIDRVGWFGSVRDLACIAAELWEFSTLPGMEWTLAAFGPGQEDPEEKGPWRSINASIGGEPGVSAQTWILQRYNGRVFVVCGVFNNADRQIHQMTPENVLKQTLYVLDRVLSVGGE